MTRSRPGLLAIGPWWPEQVDAHWRDDAYEPPVEIERQADAAVDELRERGSPAHDGMATRLVEWSEERGRLRLELQPVRWALRLLEGGASDSLTALCVVRSADGRWLAGRRAGWVSVWANRWALGAGGAVDLGESPARTLSRELAEEWSLEPERLSVEALVALPNGMTMLVGLAVVPERAQPIPDAEHDDWAWWPADVDDWPPEAHERLKVMARMLSASWSSPYVSPEMRDPGVARQGRREPR
jgi:8-oxo-dGTP diphosphatase